MRIFAGILLALAFALVNGQTITINANYGNVIVPNIDQYQYAWGVCPHDFPVDTPAYKNLVSEIGAKALHAPSSAYVGNYNWLTGSSNLGTSQSIADFKRFSDATGCGIFGIMSPHLYYNGTGGGNVDPGAVMQWCIDHNWDHSKWQYWSIGTEPYGDWDVEYISDPTLYGTMARQIITRMKQVAPWVKCGITVEFIWQPAWTIYAIKACADVLDFVEFHWYPHDDGWDPYGAMGQAPWLQTYLMPHIKSTMTTAASGRTNIQIHMGEFDFWGCDKVYGTPPTGQNTTLAAGLAYGDYYGYSLQAGVSLSSSVYFAGGGTYGCLMEWTSGEQPGRPYICTPKGWACEMWANHFGSKMTQCDVVTSPKYDVPADGRAGFANVTTANYTMVPVPYVTAYSGIDDVNKKVSLILINKHNTNSYDLNINLSNVTLSSTTAQVKIMTTDTTGRKYAGIGLMDWQDKYGMLDGGSQVYRHMPGPTTSTLTVSNNFSYTIGPHAMVCMTIPMSGVQITTPTLRVRPPATKGSIRIFDVRGALVQTLGVDEEGTNYPAGLNARLRDGIYFCQPASGLTANPSKVIVVR
jgi:hypothetical protein